MFRLYPQKLYFIGLTWGSDTCITNKQPRDPAMIVHGLHSVNLKSVVGVKEEPKMMFHGSFKKLKTY